MKKRPPTEYYSTHWRNLYDLALHTSIHFQKQFDIICIIAAHQARILTTPILQVKIRLDFAKYACLEYVSYLFPSSETTGRNYAQIPCSGHPEWPTSSKSRLWWRWWLWPPFPLPFPFTSSTSPVENESLWSLGNNQLYILQYHPYNINIYIYYIIYNISHIIYYIYVCSWLVGASEPWLLSPDTAPHLGGLFLTFWRCLVSPISNHGALWKNIEAQWCFWT